LDEAGVADRTVVILTGDNGGWLPSTNTNLGMRAGKGSAYEGGIRVPLLVRWPGVTKPGSVTDTPVIGADLYPTALEIANVRPESGQIIDGRSIVPLLQAKGWASRPLFWHYPHYHPGGARPYSAIRFENWKLIEFHEDNRVELYDLKNDPEEKADLAAKESSRAENLRKRLHRWRSEVGAQMPVPNPAYDAAREQQRPPAR
jgi:arylsulfatase A